MPMRASEINAASGAGANGGRRPTVVPAPDAADAELAARPRRRTFSAADKRHILADVDRAAAGGGIGAVLRREGLYCSTLGEWRRLRDAGAFGALTPARRGPKFNETNPLTAKVALLEKDNARLLLRRKRSVGATLLGLGRFVPDVVLDGGRRDGRPARDCKGRSYEWSYERSR